MRTPIIVLAATVAFAGCADDGADGTASPSTNVAEVPTTAATEPAATTEATPATTDVADDGRPVSTEVNPSNGLTSDELAGLRWMREEEQLAHDVYAVLGDQWDVPVFANIAESERHHIDETVALLDRYGVDDPAAGNAPGTFTDPTIQQLYDDLVAEGSTSLAGALEVGATIEELDIADLRARARVTDETAILDVYTRLERGSRNHLRAFVGRLELLDMTYAPTLLDDFDEIVGSPVERGRDA